MPRFPRRTANVVGLAENVIRGLGDLKSELPAPPRSADQLKNLVDAFQAARREALEANVAARASQKAKKAAFEELVEGLKADVGYAMVMLRGNRVLLRGLGWAWPRARRPLEAPGQVLNIKMVEQGATFIELAWDALFDGGTVATYQVQRRQKGKVWENVATAMGIKSRLENQPRGVDLEFQVLALNRAGSGMQSGVVTAVL